MYELWEVKFIGYMRLKKLHTTILPPTKGGFGSVDGAKNADAFAELVQCLDDRSLSLVIRDVKDDGRKRCRSYGNTICQREGLGLSLSTLSSRV